MGIREEKAMITKNKIIEAARILIKEKGLDNVSVDDITKEAQVAKGSFYVYYKKKEDIINDIGCMEFRYINDEIKNMEDRNILEILKFYYHRYQEGVLSIGREISKCWLQNNLNCRCKIEYDYNTISDILINAIKKNELNEDTNVTALTYKIMSNLYGLTLIWIMSNGSIKDEGEELNVQVEDILIPYLKR